MTSIEIYKTLLLSLSLPVSKSKFLSNILSVEIIPVFDLLGQVSNWRLVERIPVWTIFVEISPFSWQIVVELEPCRTHSITPF